MSAVTTTPPPGSERVRPTPALSLPARRLLVSLHVLTSVGLLGVSAAMLVLAVFATTTADAAGTQGAYVSMRVLTSSIVPPLAVAAAVTGVILSLRTRWGLLRYWWIVVKAVLTAAVILQGVLVVRPMLTSAPASHGGWLIVAAVGGQVALVAATVISIYKPWGRVGRRPGELRRSPG